MFNFSKGYYIYPGSAKKNLELRIKRHRRKSKNQHWHIDYLLADNNVIITHFIRSILNECKLNQKVKGTIPVLGFGSSDCINNCGSHLKFIKEYIG